MTSPSPSSAVASVHAAASALRSSVERGALAQWHLSWTAWTVLETLSQRGGLDAGHVAAAAGISKGTLTGIADTLERRGLIQRRVDEHDRRRVLLELTNPAALVVRAAAPSVSAVEAAAVAPLSAQEAAALDAALQKISEAIAGQQERQ